MYRVCMRRCRRVYTCARAFGFVYLMQPVYGRCPPLTQILMLGPVAAHSQYRLGLKQRALMVSPLSRVYRCFPSFRSHSMACPS